MRVVFDLDGTLALIEHRVHHIRGETKDYDAFYAACVNDETNWPVVHTLYAYVNSRHDVEVWSGRSDQVRRETEEWLRTHVSVYPGLLTRMRRAGDHQPDADLKRGWLREARAAGRAPDIVYDDRDVVVAMWRAEGVLCFQVAPGPF